MNRRVLVAMGPLLLSSCRVPWTVRRIRDAEAANSSRGDHPFRAADYVDSIWDSRVLPAARAAMSFGAWDRRGPALVQGTGRVLRHDSAGRWLVDVPPYDGRADLAIATGAAIDGTALRDALPFIQFSQFVNQVEFAQVAAALNARAAAISVSPGGEISFAGAVAIPPEGGLPELIPLRIGKAGALGALYDRPAGQWARVRGRERHSAP